MGMPTVHAEPCFADAVKATLEASNAPATLAGFWPPHRAMALAPPPNLASEAQEQPHDGAAQRMQSRVSSLHDGQSSVIVSEC